MEQFSEYEFSDLSETETVDTDYDVDDRTPIERYGFGLNTARAGDIVHIETYTTQNVRDLIPIHHYKESVKYALSIRQETFRNLILCISYGDYTRRISLSKNRLLGFADDIIQGFEIVLEQISEHNILEMYDNYEHAAEEIEQTYGASLDEFNLVTGYFAIVYDQPNSPAGGIITNKEYTEFLEVEYIEDLYGPYDCFFSCMSYVLKKKFDVDKCRKIMKINSDSGLVALRNIKRFEKAIKFNIIVYDDMIINNKPVPLYKSPSRYKNTIELVLFNQHYYIYKGIKDSTETEFDDYLNEYTKYIFYDFETYMKPHTLFMVPYAMSYCVYSEGKVESIGCIIKTNIEDNLEKTVANFFNKYMDYNTRLIGFNNGTFDDYILIDILTKYEKSLTKTIIDRTGSLLSFKIGNIISCDAYRFFKTSLEEATAFFGCKNKKQHLDHTIVQTHIENGTYNKWIDRHKNIIEEYSIADVTSLAELYFTADKYFKTIDSNLSMKNNLTISQMSMKAFKANISKYHWKLPILNKEQDDIVRQALVGGRCQIFNRCEEFEHDVQSIDVISLYPYIMIKHKYPIITFECDHKDWLKKTSEYVQNYFGIYYVRIISQPKDIIIPDRNEDGTLNWDQHKEFITWTDSISLSCLTKYGGRYEIIEGYYVKLEYHNIYEDYLGPLMREKLTQDQLGDNCNKAMRSCTKLLMNSLSGKMAQKSITSEKRLCNKADACNKMISKYKDNATVIEIRDQLFLIEGEYKDKNIKVKSPTILAIMIYAYARKYMYDNFISKIKYKYGMDTDSLFIRASETSILENNGIIGTMPGQVRIELPNNCKGIYVDKKVYANYTIDNNGHSIIYKLKFKGINKTDKFVPPHKADIVKWMINNNKWSELNKLWNTLEDAFMLDTLRKLLHNEQVHILSSQLKKSFKDKDLSESFFIRGKFVLKTYPYDANVHMMM